LETRKSGFAPRKSGFPLGPAWTFVRQLLVEQR
jgi:hypothetical protein